MRRRDLIAALAAGAALAACQRQEAKTETPASGDSASSAGGRAMTDPAQVVRTLYTPYMGADAHPPGFEDSVPWSAQMTTDLAAMRARTQAGDESSLDFDPVVDAQDFRISDVSATTEALAENSHATVRASFTNLGEHKEIVYDMVWEGDRWKVDNIRTAQWDMRQMVTHPS